MSDLDRIVQDALREPYAVARAHGRSGGRVIGYVGAEIPVELIVATRAFPIRLPSFADIGSGAAERYLESSFAPEILSIAEQYLSGELDFLDAIILTRSNDSAQRLYYYLTELRTRGLVRGPKPLIYDLAMISRETSRAHSCAATERLAAEIGADPAAMPDAIKQRNRRRDLFARSAQRRLLAAGPRGSVMDRIFRVADRCEADIFDDALSAWLMSSAANGVGPRLLLLGSAPPDERLHVAVEAAGGNVVAEFGDHPSCGPSLPNIAPEGSFAAIANHYRSLKSSSRAFVDRALLAKTTASAVSAQGVIIWLVEQEDALIWDLPAQLSVLRGAGIPVLPLVRRRWDGADGTLEAITTFTSSLKGRK